MWADCAIGMTAPVLGSEKGCRGQAALARARPPGGPGFREGPSIPLRGHAVPEQFPGDGRRGTTTNNTNKEEKKEAEVGGTCSRDAEPSERAGASALRSEDCASRLHGALSLASAS